MLYEFGMKGNQGAERMSEFLKRIRVDNHAGISPTALRTMMRVIEEELPEFQREQEEAQKGEGVRQIVAAGDETWLGEQMLLALMDLGSGYQDDLERWRSWGEWASNNFHRASSAAEGRNGVSV
ncbi:MAG TPA: hypothetical protein G4N96_08290 [Chloroflexi bacterium]|nr:hypothetical protein [Chloroflexota bacterium]